MKKTKSVRIIEVIEVATYVGQGTEIDPNRIVIELWSKDGELSATSIRTIALLSNRSSPPGWMSI